MVNIVMLCHDRPALTAQALDSLYSHTKPDRFTLTVVDDGSNIMSRRYLAFERPNYTCVRVEHSGHVLSQLKNLGVYWTGQRFPHAKDGWLYLSDNDVWFAPGWLDALTEVAETTERHGYRLWGGQSHPYHQAVPEPGLPSIDRLEVLDGPSWLMRWESWRLFGPFDRTTAPGVCQSEEYPLCARVRSSGHRIGVIRPHVVVHTGLTNSDGKPAPGAEERRKLIPSGVYAE